MSDGRQGRRRGDERGDGRAREGCEGRAVTGRRLGDDARWTRVADWQGEDST